MIKRQDQFNRALTEKLLTYATGRELGISDRGELDRILTQFEQSEGGLKDLLTILVESSIFQHK